MAQLMCFGSQEKPGTPPFCKDKKYLKEQFLLYFLKLKVFSSYNNSWCWFLSNEYGG